MTTEPTPKTWYEVKKHFGRLGWGSMVDGYADRSDAMDFVSEALGDDLDVRLQVICVDLDEGTARDVTEDMVSKVRADLFCNECERPTDHCACENPHSYDFQRREAFIAGHFS